MHCSWPLVLFALLLVPLAVALYIWLLRRRRRFAVRYLSLSLIREAVPRRSRWRRHLPFALYLASIVSLIVAASRPQAVIAVPINKTSIILALDVSLSMCSSDVLPNRLTVAQNVAAITGEQYYQAQDAGQLKKVFENLPPRPGDARQRNGGECRLRGHGRARRDACGWTVPRLEPVPVTALSGLLATRHPPVPESAGLS